MSKLIALDLGGHRVKAAIYEGAFGRFQLESVQAIPVPQDSENPPSTEARLAAAQQMLDSLHTGERPAYVLAWPAEQTSFRHVTLPFGEKAQVEKVLPFEVEGMVPYDMEDMELRHRIIQLAPGDSHVLAAIVDRQTLAGQLEALAGIGADPRSVDLDADVMADLADPAGPAVGAAVQAIIDLGHTRTIIALCRGGELIAARALDVGGRQLTRALADAHGLDWDEAEIRKHQASLATSGGGIRSAPSPAQVEWEDEPETQPGVRPPGGAPSPQTPNLKDGLRDSGDAGGSDAGAVLRAAFVPQLAELRSTLISFEDTHKVEVDEVVLIGGGRHLDGLRSLLSASLGVPIRMPGIADTAAVDDAPGAWSLVLALGRRASRGRTPALELRQGELRFKGDLYMARQVGIYGGVFAACALLAGTAMFAFRTVQLNREVAALDDQIRSAVVDTFPGEVSPERITSPTDAMAIMTEKTVEVTTRVESLGSIVTDEPPTVALLRDLSAAMPPHGEARVDVEELTMTSSTITIEAETDGYEAATKVESSLQAVPRFANAKKGDEKRTRGGAVTFEITIPRDRESAEGEEG